MAVVLTGKLLAQDPVLREGDFLEVEEDLAQVKTWLVGLADESFEVREEAERALEATRSAGAAVLIVESYQSSQDPEAQARLCRILHLEEVSAASAVVTGRVTMVRNDSIESMGLPCECLWGACPWAVLSVDAVMVGEAWIEDARRAYPRIREAGEHIHVPEAALAHGEVVVAQEYVDPDVYEKGFRVPLTRGDEGVWILQPGREGCVDALRFIRLPAAYAQRLLALREAGLLPETSTGEAGDLAERFCPRCREMGFTADVGACSRCGGETFSGAARYCHACGLALHACEACGAPLVSASHPQGEPGGEPR